MQPLGTDKKTKKKSCNLLGQENYATSWDKKKVSKPLRTKKIMQPLGTKKITQPLGAKKIKQPFLPKKIMQPLRTTTKKSRNLSEQQQKITQPLGTTKNSASSRDKNQTKD